MIVLSHMLRFDSKNMQSEAHCPVGPGIPERAVLSILRRALIGLGPPYRGF